ncbi:MAG: hypothetical protein N3D11_04800 [Candidatus Sumerlaeia bacterium]|nr:hypothetical protein [Candidatus Sumerlaeia bacterium]
MNREIVARGRNLTVSRRQWIGTLAVAGLASRAGAEESPPQGPWAEPPVVARVYLTGKTTHWPRLNLDVSKEVAEIEDALAAIAQKHKGRIRWVGGEVAASNDEVAAWGKKYPDPDVVLIIPVSTPAASVGAVLNAVNAPALVFSRPYAGHQWAEIAGLRKAGRRVDCLASGNFKDLESYIPLFNTVRQMRRSKVLVAADNKTGWYHACHADFAKHFGMTFQYMAIDDLRPVFERADKAAGEREAAAFSDAARDVVEPKPEEIRDALRFYIGLRNLMRQENANAFTIDCFPALLAKKLPAYPCIAWSKLNDQGLYGVCQADVRATMTQMLVTSFSRMPGFVSNPVFDTGRNEVIHSHCVAATRMLGLDKAGAPYLIRSHLETAEGAVLQVVMPVKEFVTVGQFADPKTFLLTTGEAVGTTSKVSGSRDADCGCRTKVRTRVHGDAEQWLAGYTTGVHRVLFYGNHVKAIERLGRLLGFDVVRET